MKNLITIAALVLVAGGCSLIRVPIKTGPAMTPAQAAQLVLTNPGTFDQVGREWLRLHPCIVTEASDGRLTVTQSGTESRLVELPVAAGCPVGARSSLPGAVIPAEAATLGGGPAALPVIQGNDGSALGGSPVADFDITAIQEAQDSTDYYRQQCAARNGIISIKNETITNCVKWIVGLSLAVVLLITGVILILKRK